MKVRVLPVLLVILLLCGCASSVEAMQPEFDPAAAQEATGEISGSQRLSREETFQNANGSVEFHVDLDAEIFLEPMAVVEAIPRELTAQDAHDIIYALFPQAQCYERHPKYTSPETSWTKARLEKNLERWRSYDFEDLAAIYGGVENLPVAMRENGEDIPFVNNWEESLAYFEQLLETAPEEDMRTPSLWHMFKESEYLEEPEEAARMDLSKDRDCIMANVEAGENTYSYVVANGNPLAKSSNLINLSYNTPDSPASVDWQIFLSENDALPPLTQEDLDLAGKRAQAYLDKLPVGDWILADPMPSDHDGTIYISGDPAEAALPPSENVVMDAASYQMPELSMRLHPDGRLLNLSIRGSLAQVTTRVEKAAELPLETLLDTALNHLREEKTMAYGISEENLKWLQIQIEEDVSCQIQVTNAKRGFARLNTPTGGVCNVPSLTVLGTVTYTGKETGRICRSTDSPFIRKGEIPVAVINAIDGTIIPLTQ